MILIYILTMKGTQSASKISHLKWRKTGMKVAFVPLVLHPICYQNNVNLNTDPLYQLEDIIRISNKNDFMHFLSSSISNKYIKSEITNIRNYSSSVFTKINYDVLFDI